MGEKHTPGPWSLPHFAEPDCNCECEYVLCDHLMGAVATVHCSGEGDDWQKHGDNPKFTEAVANAHLIAAAPDMKAAILTCRCPGGGWNGMPDRLIDICTVKDCLDHEVCGCNLGAVIRKAEGVTDLARVQR